ncbi:MAG: response regulator, partial [Gemmatimonadetes bacterium]|nr:response regulator [Gemmatimonadota bacterium]
VAVASIARDVTEQRWMAETLDNSLVALQVAADEARLSEEATRRFLADAAHQLRTPMAGIRACAETLLRGAEPEDADRLLATMVRETSRAARLISSLLQIARLDQGLSAPIVPVDLVRLCADEVERLSLLSPDLDVALEVRHPPTGPLLLDAAGCQEILSNLGDNACRHAASRIRVILDVGPSAVRVVVAEDGPGVAEEAREQVFARFVSLDGRGGSGLGLPIARRLARLMGGDVRVESESGVGSEFIVELPVAGAQTRADGDGELSSTVVALVRDDENLLHLQALATGRVRIIGTTDPIRLVALARRESPDLIALDAGAPEYSAWRALSALREDIRTDTIPTVLLVSDEENPDMAMDLGTFAVLSKPVSLDRVSRAVRRAASRTAGCAVVIAEDDPDLRRILGEALAAAGCTARAAADGEEALEVMMLAEADVALLDLVMPGLDGIATIARMRARSSLRALPVILFVNPELTLAEMEELQQSVLSTARKVAVPLRPVLDILAEGCGKTAAAAASRAIA